MTFSFAVVLLDTTKFNRLEWTTYKSNTDSDNDQGVSSAIFTATHSTMVFMRAKISQETCCICLWSGRW